MDKRASDVASRGQIDSIGLIRLVSNRQVGADAKLEDEGLDLEGIVVRIFRDDAGNPLDRLLVAFAANDAIVGRRAVSNVL